MKDISNMPKDLQGKVITQRLAVLDLDLNFGLWQNYEQWLDMSGMTDFWYDISTLENAQVTLEVRLGTETVFEHVFSKFGPIKIHHVFEDMEPGACDLVIKISNLDVLPIRDDTGIFVSGMFEILSLKLQDVEIKHLLENTMLGVDSSLTLSISRPVYSWMVNNWRHILPDAYNFLHHHNSH